MEKRNYVGLACTGHDNALAIVHSDGKLVFAEATERYLQNKRAFNSPPDDLLRVGRLIKRYCEPDAELVIVKTWSDDAINILRAEGDMASKEIEKPNGAPATWKERYLIYRHIMTLFAPNIQHAGMNLAGYCTKNAIPFSFRAYDHHRTHAATGYYTSEFDDAVCAIVDGAGEGAALKLFFCKDGRIEDIDIGPAPHGGMGSLGLFYGLTLCSLCGFDGWKGEEWKVMGLAAYGKLNKKVYDLMRQYIQIKGFHVVFPDEGMPAYLELLSYARKPDAPAETVADVAYTGQLVFSELVTEILDKLYDLGLSENLILGGGCALNSSYAGHVVEQTKFKALHIASAPADDGNAIGAAKLAFYEDHPHVKHKPAFQSPYLGSTMSEETVQNVKKFGRIKKLSTLPSGRLQRKAAEFLAQGKIIGWVQGCAEFGPRALGNRSILADPRDIGVKDKINSLVKFREEFRPFAPSILHEFGDQYFCDYQESPYMERTLMFREDVRHKVPGVVHLDGTGRLQTVKREWNESFYTLIREFYDITGVPLVVNTSFNIMGKPIIHSVEDAIAVFYTTGLDVLFFDENFIEKEAHSSEVRLERSA